MFYRFIFTGLLNTVFGYIVYSAILFNLKDPQMSLNISYFLGIFFNYFSYKSITFKSGSSITFLKFVITYLFLLFINKKLFYQLNILTSLNDYLSQLICLPIMVVLSWFIFKNYVFKND